MSKSKEVAPEGSKELANVNFEEDAGAGFENADSESFALPILKILQKLSPVCDDDSESRIPDARPGQLMNAVTLERFDASAADGDPGVYVIPVHFKRSFIEWKPRNSGGGFVAEHDVIQGKELLRTCERDETTNRDMLPNGNELHDTRCHYVLLVNQNGTVTPAMIPMTSTQIKKSKRWLSVMDNVKMTRADGTLYTPATFSHRYKLQTVTEKKDQNSWKGWVIGSEEPLEDAAHYQAAKQFRELLMAGKVEENFDQMKDTAAEAEATM